MGKCFLVRKKSTGDIFCMKRLNRSELARKNLETIRVERDILAETTNPFVYICFSFLISECA